MESFKSKLKKRIEIEQAYLNGSDIESLTIMSMEGEYYPDISPTFDWTVYDYRITIKPLTFWVNIYDAERCYVHRTLDIATKNLMIHGKTIMVMEVLDN